MPERLPIKQVIDRRGLRFKWLAAKLGMDPGNFHHILAGRRKPPEHFYERLAALLWVDVDEIAPPSNGHTEEVA